MASSCFPSLFGERDQLLAPRVEEGIGAHQQRLRPEQFYSFKCAMDFALVAPSTSSNAGGIAARPVDARDQAQRDGILASIEDDRNARRRRLGGKARKVAARRRRESWPSYIPGRPAVSQ